MHLQQIKLIHFKNYETQSLDFSEQLNCFVGLNGMGKTNMLDAIYYLCVGKSYFALNDRAVVRQQSEDGFFRLEGQFWKENKLEQVVVKVIPGKRKEIEHNRVAYQKLSEHLGHFPVVMLSPFDINIALEGSEGRRRFLDNSLSQLDGNYLHQLIQYNKLLAQRNALLKQMAERRSFQAELLEVYDLQMIPLGQSVFEKRQQFLNDFATHFQHFHHIISAEQEQVSYRYKSSLENGDFETLLQEAVEKDRILQRSTVGIHKDDIQFLIGEYPLKRYASQGQLKSFVLALKLAQYRLFRLSTGQAPLLLLDDIFDRLDGERVTHLVQLLLQEEFGQVFITDTDEERMTQLIEAFGVSYRKFVVKDGSITHLNLNGN
ncbi:MAG: DNA replication and repair protein RecF [Bacteroidota bacterium]